MDDHWPRAFQQDNMHKRRYQREEVPWTNQRQRPILSSTFLFDRQIWEHNRQKDTGTLGGWGRLMGSRGYIHRGSSIDLIPFISFTSSFLLFFLGRGRGASGLPFYCPPSFHSLAPYAFLFFFSCQQAKMKDDPSTMRAKASIVLFVCFLLFTRHMNSTKQ